MLVVGNLGLEKTCSKEIFRAKTFSAPLFLNTEFSQKTNKQADDKVTAPSSFSSLYWFDLNFIFCKNSIVEEMFCNMSVHLNVRVDRHAQTLSFITTACLAYLLKLMANKILM